MVGDPFGSVGHLRASISHSTSRSAMGGAKMHSQNAHADRKRTLFDPIAAAIFV